MRRDRDGSIIEEDEQTPLPLALHLCENGWRGEDENGRPIPCLQCRPHLVPKRQAHL